MHERSESHQTIEVGGQIIGKLEAGASPRGWGTLQGRYSSGGTIPLPSFESKANTQESVEATSESDDVADGKSRSG